MTAIDDKQIQAFGRRRRRFREAIIQAEARRLGRILRSSGPPRRETIIRQAPGRDNVEVVRALRAGAARGEIRDLGGATRDGAA